MTNQEYIDVSDMARTSILVNILHETNPSTSSVIKEVEYNTVYRIITNWEQKFLDIRSIKIDFHKIKTLIPGLQNPLG